MPPARRRTLNNDGGRIPIGFLRMGVGFPRISKDTRDPEQSWGYIGFLRMGVGFLRISKDPRDPEQ